MAAFLASLTKNDLAPATLRGYRYDLQHFLAWRQSAQDTPFTVGSRLARASARTRVASKSARKRIAMAVLQEWTTNQKSYEQRARESPK